MNVYSKIINKILMLLSFQDINIKLTQNEMSKLKCVI